MIVVRDRMAAKGERHRRKVAIIAGKAVLNGAAKGRLIARRRHLIVVRQTGRIAIDRLGHPERARLAGHQLGEIILVARNGFGDHDGGVVGRARHQSLDGVFDADGLARAQSEFGRRLIGGVLGHLHFGIELHLAGIEALEQQIKRHDLGERGGMAARVGIIRRKRRAGVAVYNDGGERRAVAFMRLLVVARRMMMVPVTARLGGIGGESGRGGDRDEPEEANSHNTRGSQGCAKHELSRPNF
ncbi:hypothetical protein GALL_477940 [mine drainage metagenome]|uniref:Uncharacterized protein n=1 Tax=mine drainage metagenome TaxID=410659 RepID=A0A1J5PII1_9ZZZZ